MGVALLGRGGAHARMTQLEPAPRRRRRARRSTARSSSSAVAGNFVLGALMTLGIGLYAPCMILVSLLGMNPKAAFPIMMGSCAFLMPVGERCGSSASARYDAARGARPRDRRHSRRCCIAAFIVKSLPLTAVRWLVVVVVVYTAVTMLRSAARERAAAAAGKLPNETGVPVT